MLIRSGGAAAGAATQAGAGGGPIMAAGAVTAGIAGTAGETRGGFPLIDQTYTSFDVSGPSCRECRPGLN